MAIRRLTKRTIESAPVPELNQPSDRKRWEWVGDSEVPGFGVKIYGTGRKVFALRYRTRSGSRTRMITIGTFGEMTVQQARDEARNGKAKVREGKDPQAERERDRRLEGLVTVGDLLSRWLEDYAKKDGGRRSWREDQRRLTRSLRPTIGRIQLSDLTHADVKRLHRDLGQSGKVEANRTIETLRAAWKWARDEDLIPDGVEDPTKRYGGHRGYKFRERPRDRWLRPDETRRLLEATDKEADAHVRSAIRLLLLTGLRKSELLSARWENVDLERGEIRLPDTKSGEQQTRTLVEDAVRILRQLPRVSGSPFVFPSPTDPARARGDLKKPWARIREAAGIQDVTLHDLRRTCGSYLAQAGVPIAIIRDILGHMDEKVTRLYARLSEEDERRALEGLSRTVADVMTGTGPSAAQAENPSLPDRLRELLESTTDPAVLMGGLRELVDPGRVAPEAE